MPGCLPGYRLASLKLCYNKTYQQIVYVAIDIGIASTWKLNCKRSSWRQRLQDENGEREELKTETAPTDDSPTLGPNIGNSFDVGI